LRVTDPGLSHRLHVAVVGAAAAAEHGEARQTLAERHVLVRQLLGVTHVELLGLVQLRVAQARRVGAEAADPVRPLGARLENVVEVGRMRTVEHHVRRGGAGARVELLDRRAEWLAAGQAPVRLDGEGDHYRETDGLRGANDSHGLVEVRHRDRSHQVDARLGERSNLRAVVVGGLVGRHRLPDHVSVPTRADAAGDHDRGGLGLELVAELVEELDCTPVERLEPVARVTHPRRPVGARAPGRRLEHDPDAAGERDLDVGLEVAAQCVLPAFPREQVVCGEVGQVVAVVKDEGRLEAAVRQERRLAELG